MDKLLITGGNRLNGEIAIAGAKRSLADFVRWFADCL